MKQFREIKFRKNKILFIRNFSPDYFLRCINSHLSILFLFSSGILLLHYYFTISYEIVEKYIIHFLYSIC